MKQSETKFLIRETFELASRKSFVFAGMLDYGNISPGMTLLSPIGSPTLKVDSIEDLRSEQDIATIALVFKYQNEQELVVLKEIGKSNFIFLSN